MIVALTALLLGASSFAPATQLGDAMSLRTQLQEAEFIGLVRPGARDLAQAPTSSISAFQPSCVRVELDVVEIWRGAAVEEITVSYPANRLFPRAPHLPEGELRLVFLRQSHAGDWQVVGETRQMHANSAPTDRPQAAFRAAVERWEELSVLAKEDRPLAEYRWIIEQFRQPVLRNALVAELTGTWQDHSWTPGEFSAQAAKEPSSFWLSVWPEVSVFDAEGRGFVSLLRQSDPDAAAAWLIGQLDTKWRQAERSDWSQLLATITALASDARFADATRGETAFHRFLDSWMEAEAAKIDRAELKPAYFELRAELLGWLTQAEAVHRSPW